MNYLPGLNTYNRKETRFSPPPVTPTAVKPDDCVWWEVLPFQPHAVMCHLHDSSRNGSHFAIYVRHGGNGDSAPSEYVQNLLWAPSLHYDRESQSSRAGELISVFPAFIDGSFALSISALALSHVWPDITVHLTILRRDIREIVSTCPHKTNSIKIHSLQNFRCLLGALVLVF